MESDSVRRCDHCTQPLPQSMRRDARFCNSACRSAHSNERKAQPEAAVWVPGRWKIPRPSAARRRRVPAWVTVSPVIALLDAQKRAEAF